MGLCCGFVLETALIHKDVLVTAVLRQLLFLFLTTPHQGVGRGCTRSREGTQTGQLIPGDQMGPGPLPEKPGAHVG